MLGVVGARLQPALSWPNPNIAAVSTLIEGLFGPLGVPFYELVGMPVFGLVGVLVLGLLGGLVFGVVFGLTVCLVFGGYACLSHCALRLVLWRTDALPLDSVRFLDYSTERVFLRKVGAGYIFVHRLLQEYFAALENRSVGQGAMSPKPSV